MPIPVPALFDAIGDLLVAQWPEVDGKILYAEHANLLPWGNKSSPDAGLTPPFATVLLEGLTRDLRWGPGSRVYHVAPRIFYARAVEGLASPITAKLLALENALETGVLNLGTGEAQFGEFLRTLLLDWGDDLTANQVLADKGEVYRVGYVDFEALLGS